MKTRTSIMLAVWLLASILVALPVPVGATAPEPLTITANLVMTGENSAAGTFTISGLFTDSGYASQVYFLAGKTTHGVKTLEGAEGSITIKYQAQVTWTSETTGFAEGQFTIVSGTGKYANLHGVGETYAEVDLGASPYPTITATYTGEAHFD